MSFTSPITRSRSLATANSELNHTSKETVSHSRKSLSEQPSIAAKLAELLKAAETSITTSEQNKDTFAEAHELEIRKQNDLLKSQEQHARNINITKCITNWTSYSPDTFLWQTHR